MLSGLAKQKEMNAWDRFWSNRSEFTQTFRPEAIFDELMPKDSQGYRTFTARKALYWGTTAAAISTVVLAQRNYGVLTTASEWNSSYFQGAIYSFEPLVFGLNLMLATFVVRNIPKPSANAATQPPVQGPIIEEVKEDESDSSQLGVVKIDPAPVLDDQPAKCEPSISKDRYSVRFVDAQGTVEHFERSKSRRAASLQAAGEESASQASVNFMSESEEEQSDEEAATWRKRVRQPVSADLRTFAQREEDEHKEEPSKVSYSANHEAYPGDVRVDIAVIAPAAPLVTLTPAIMAQRELNKQVAVIIPCHFSIENISDTLIAALQHVAPSQILIIDNGRSALPLDDLQRYVKTKFIHDGGQEITYVWQHDGSKNRAEHTGAKIALNKDLIYSLTIDDDTLIPQDMVLAISTAKISQGTHKGACKAVSFPLTAISTRENDPNNKLVGLQRAGYYLSDLSKLTQDRLGGVLYMHGGACLWDTKVLIEVFEGAKEVVNEQGQMVKKILEAHDLVFYAEDWKKGQILARHGYTIAFSMETTFQTKAPASLFGETPNYYQQQVRSWLMGPQVYFNMFLYSLAFNWNHKLPGAAMIKLQQFYDAFSIPVVYMQVILLILKFNNPTYWAINGAFIAGGMLPPALLKLKIYLNDRQDDLRIDWRDCALMPFFKVISNGMSVLAAARALFIYLPNFKKPLSIVEFNNAILANPNLLREIQEEDEKFAQAGDRNYLVTHKKLVATNWKFFQRPVVNTLPALIADNAAQAPTHKLSA